MEDISQLAAAIDAERVRRARNRNPPEAGFLEPARLFDAVCGRMLVGLRIDHPDATDEELENLLSDRIDKLRRLEEAGIYEVVGYDDEGD